MFIRKRTRKLKDGSESITYQAVKCYRWRGRVRQRVVSLGSNSDPKAALEEELLYMKTAQRGYEYPLQKWIEVRISPSGNPYEVKLSHKQAQRRREFWRKIFESHLKRVGKLESIVSQYETKKNDSDTTSFQNKKEEGEN